MAHSAPDLLAKLRGGLIVSCQAQPAEPLHGSAHMVAMARAAAQGGAVGLRCESPVDISAIRAVVDLPMIGLWKRGDTGVVITPTVTDVAQVAAAGAQIIADDVTARPRPTPVAELIRAVHAAGCVVLADASTVEEALAAAEAGADAVAPTLAGYTGPGPVPLEPAWDVLAALIARSPVPVFMEGRLWTPAEAARALAMGAWAVVVGSAITRPQLITRRFVDGLKG